MNRDKLETIIRVLEDVPDSEFNMGHWMCGTTGCAIGHAGHLIGLDMSSGMPVLGRRYGISAVMECLDLSYDEVSGLFLWHEYSVNGLNYHDSVRLITKKMVIDKIRAFIGESNA